METKRISWLTEVLLTGIPVTYFPDATPRPPHPAAGQSGIVTVIADQDTKSVDRIMEKAGLSSRKYQQ